MLVAILRSPLIGLILFILLCLITALFAGSLSKRMNRRRDSMFERLAAKYDFTVTTAGRKYITPEPVAQGNTEMRKISGVIQNKSVIVQDIQEYPEHPADTTLARWATPDKMSVSRGGSSRSTTRFFLDNNLVPRSQKPEMDIQATEKEITSFLDSLNNQ